MNSRERIRAAMRHAPVDRVPVMCQLSVGHYLLNTRVSPADLWFTSEGFAEALVTLQRRYRFDGILINLLGTDPDWRKDVSRIETAPDGSQAVYYRNGDTARCPADDNVHHFAAQRRVCPTLDGVDPDQVYYDDPHGVGGLKYPFYFGLDPYGADRDHYWPDYVFRTIDLVVAEVAGEVSVHSEVFSPWTQLMELFGYEQSLLYMLDDPGKIHAILRSYTQGTVDLARRQARRGVDAVLISSAFAGGGFISPGQYEEFVLPYEQQVVAEVQREGVAVYTHTCGKIGDRLELMVATGLDGIDTLDPPPLGTVDLADAKRRVGAQIFFKGNIDPVHTLLRKTPGEVREVALERLRVGSPGSGYLSRACSVSPRVPPANLLVLAESAEEFARRSDVGKAPGSALPTSARIGRTPSRRGAHGHTLFQAELIRLSTDLLDLLDQASYLEKQALAEHDRAQRQLCPAYARQYREKAAQLEKDAVARRRDAQRAEQAHGELAKRHDRFE